MKLLELISLTDKNHQKFNSISYDLSLDNSIEEIRKTYQINIFNESISPMATSKFNWENAINEQCFEIDINSGKKVIISCNPFNEIQQKKYALWQIYLTKPTTYIYFLSKQLCQNSTEGIFKLIHFYATKNKINDIHICNEHKNTKIQFSSKHQKNFTIFITTNFGKKISHYIKLISQINTSITNQPQNGSYKFKENDCIIEGRTSTLPIIGGEMISLRLFHKNNSLETFESLGFTATKIKAINEMINVKNGLILITGPTGSGKSTTLYTILKKLKSKHIISIEDPIEQIINSIHQTNINKYQNFTLETAFKAALRHNPDIIAIGEIRDIETAEVVLNAAYSGHLVIASLHTNNIESTLLRLANLGCNPFMISYCLRGIISQELSPSNKNELQLTSSILHCKKPFIIHDLKKDLTEFLNANSILED